MSALIPFPGGKSYLADLICQRLPPHTCFGEPFAGSIAVLLKKRPSEIEWAADLNQDLIHFFQVLREAGSYESILQRLTWLCNNMPHSRKLYESWWHDWARGWRLQDPVERAAIWFYLQVNSVNGKSGWVHSPTDNKAKVWFSHVDKLKWFAQRLRHVQFESRDFRDTIPRWDRENSLVYCDPPYAGVPNIREYYGNDFTEKDHRDLAEILNHIVGKAIVSYYPDPLVNELYQGWHRLEIPQVKYSMGAAPDDLLEGKPSSVELLLFNYPPDPLFAWADTKGD